MSLVQIDGQAQKCHVHENTVKFQSLRVYPIFCRLFAIQLYSIIPNGGIDVSVYIASGVLCYFGQT